MKWIKASERLPDEDNKKVICQWFYKDGNSGLYKGSKQWLESCIKRHEGDAVFKWLDESETTSPGYWQKRCEAAEQLYQDEKEYMSHCSGENFIRLKSSLEIWQQLKSSPPQTKP